MIKAVLFDVDGVVIDSFNANLQFFNDVFSHLGLPHITAAQYKTAFHLPAKEVLKKFAPELSTHKVEDTYQSIKRGEIRYPDELTKLNPGAIETIKSLSTPYKTGLVTSRIREGVYQLSQLSEIVKIVQVIVTFDDTDKHKPDPDPIELALEKLNIKPDEAVYIGDAETDFLSARAAGVKMIMFNKPEVKGADGYVENFSEVPELIKKLD